MFDHIMLNTDWFVVGIDSYRHKGFFDRVAQTLDRNPGWNKRLLSVTHDLTAPLSHGQLKKIGDVDYIINLASLADVWDSVKDPVPFVRNNVDLMINMLEFARTVWGLRGKNKTPPEGKVFIHFSTDEVYGPAAANQGHPEWATPVPSNPYSASKAMQEMVGIAYWRSYGVPLIITNTMNNFGEMQGSSKYPVIIQNAVNAGEKVKVHVSSDGQIGTRYYIHSRNVADAVLFILKNTQPYIHKAGEVDKPDRYNIVGTAQMDNLELAKVIARLMNKPLKYEFEDFHSREPGHDLHYGLDGTKLANLGWKPPVDFETSLKKTIEWQENNQEWIES